MKAEYQFGQPSRFNSVSLGSAAVGVNADAHTRNDPLYFRMVETARHLERNDRLCGALLTRLVTNVCRAEVALNPQTGSDAVDAHLKRLWDAWSNDAAQCDHRGKFTFHKAAKVAFRRMVCDGDVFALPLKSGRLQWLENHRCRTPSNALKRTKGVVPVHGVETDTNGKPTRYYFTKEDVALGQTVQRMDEVSPRDAFDNDGHPLVLHLAIADRFTATRGVTAFAPCADDPSMLSDAIFADLVRMQAQSCITFFRERDIGFELKDAAIADGENIETVELGAYSQDEVELTPGMERRGLPGEKLHAFSPAIQGSGWRDYVLLMARIVAANIGVPLHVLLFDASETNFSGWRGSVNEARQRFDELLSELIAQLYEPVYRWKLRGWLESDDVLKQLIATEATKGELRLWAPAWNRPAWPSVQPREEAESNTIRLSTAQVSLTEFHHSEGRDFDDVIQEVVTERTKAVRAAKVAAKEINDEFKDNDPVSWRDLCPLPISANVKITQAVGEQPGTPSSSNQGATNAA